MPDIDIGVKVYVVLEGNSNEIVGVHLSKEGAEASVEEGEFFRYWITYGLKP